MSRTHLIPPPPRATITPPPGFQARARPQSFAAFDPGLAASSGVGWCRYLPDGVSAAGVFVLRSSTLEGKLAELRAERSSALFRGVPIFIEHMKVYPGPRQQGDQNDLISLAVAEGVLIGDAAEFELVTARDWAGTVPKETRARRILGAEDRPGLLDARELAIVNAIPGRRVHNAIDAIGLALWVAGRL